MFGVILPDAFQERHADSSIQFFSKNARFLYEIATIISFLFNYLLFNTTC